jgi:ribosomal protein S12 methylthiotransferase accessory factor YcaO
LKRIFKESNQEEIMQKQIVINNIQTTNEPQEKEKQDSNTKTRFDEITSSLFNFSIDTKVINDLFSPSKYANDEEIIEIYRILFNAGKEAVNVWHLNLEEKERKKFF